MSSDDNSFSRSGQKLALRWMERSLAHPAKASEIRASPSESFGAETRRAQRLHSDALRHLRLYRHLIDRHARKEPPLPLLAVLLLALAEISSSRDTAAPAVVDSWTGIARNRGGKKSAGFANAVLRKLVPELEEARSGKSRLPAGILFSHPDWLVERWTRQWGSADCHRLLQWNQQIASTYAEMAHPVREDPADDNLIPSRWPGFFLVRRLDRNIEEKLRSGRLTIRDPATRIATSTVLRSHPATVLDLCASPGGKSRGLLSSPHPPSELVAVDLPDRMERLRENLAPWETCATLRAADLETGDRLPAEWIGAFDAVLLDTPCSNTGVLRRKPDAKWRLRPEDIRRMPKLQFSLLERAAAFVRPGGSLVYSTCSLEDEENAGLVRRFLESPTGHAFSLRSAVHALPFKTGHDGAGVFRLDRFGSSSVPGEKRGRSHVRG